MPTIWENERWCGEMIKGVNKKVIEVTGVESAYYEKAILFIKPQYAGMEEEFLEIEAKRVLRNIDVTSNIKRKRRVMEKVMIGVGAAVITATICLIFLL